MLVRGVWGLSLKGREVANIQFVDVVGGVGLRLLPAGKVIKNLVGAYNMFMTSSPRVYGLREGVVEGFKRQYLKFWFRWQVLRAVKEMGSMPEVPDLAHSCAHEAMK